MSGLAQAYLADERVVFKTLHSRHFATEAKVPSVIPASSVAVPLEEVVTLTYH